VESGDEVWNGDAIAVIESPEIQNQLLQEKSKLSSLKVELDRQHITARQQPALATRSI
jgi:HlyD family secretion protein